jgi:hypothetical protein
MHLKSAVTRELFNLIAEIRISMPSGTLAEHIKRKLLPDIQALNSFLMCYFSKNSTCSSTTRQGCCTSLSLCRNLARCPSSLARWISSAIQVMLLAILIKASPMS